MSIRNELFLESSFLIPFSTVLFLTINGENLLLIGSKNQGRNSKSIGKITFERGTMVDKINIFAYHGVLASDVSTVFQQ